MKTLEKIVNQYGNKVRQRTDNEDRTLPYRNMIYNENGLYAIDQDLICVTFQNKIPEAKAVLELTRIDNYGHSPSPKYFESILNRYSKRDQQKYMSVWFGNMLKAPVYIVAFAENLTAFHMYNLTEDNGNWFKQNKLEHLEWHYNIRDMKIPYYIYEKYEQNKSTDDAFADLG